MTAAAHRRSNGVPAMTDDAIRSAAVSMTQAEARLHFGVTHPALIYRKSKLGIDFRRGRLRPDDLTPAEWETYRALKRKARLLRSEALVMMGRGDLT